MSFGPKTCCPEECAKARQSAADIFAKVRLGQDPQAERRSEQQKAGDVFEELGQRYLKAAKARLRPGSYREVAG